MPRGRAGQRVVGVAAYVAALVLLTLELGSGERLPLSGLLVLAGFLGAHVGAGLLLGQWRWVALCFLLLPVAVTAGAISDDFFLAVTGVIFLVPASAVCLAIGVGSAKLLDRSEPGGGSPDRKRRNLVAAGLLSLAALPLPWASVDKERTVRVERPNSIPLDEERGSIMGVGLGDSAAKVRSVFGQAPPWTMGQPLGPRDGEDDVGGPTYLPTAPGRADTFLRYRKHSFWISGGRVWSIQTIERRAQTNRRVGVGDSLSLVKQAYPQLRCDEGSVGSDAPIPFPYCTGQTGPRSYIYFSADYNRAGTPVTSITLFPLPIE
jgi:hypothetical protein